jgi:hypothetical protein
VGFVRVFSGCADGATGDTGIAVRAASARFVASSTAVRDADSRQRAGDVFDMPRGNGDTARAGRVPQIT